MDQYSVTAQPVSHFELSVSLNSRLVAIMLMVPCLVIIMVMFTLDLIYKL